MGNTMSEEQKTYNQIELLQKIYYWRMAFFGVIILIAGLLIGSAVTLTTIQNVPKDKPVKHIETEQATKNIVNRLRQQLRLSPEQAEKIEPILQNRLQNLDDIRANAIPKINEEIILLNEEVSILLTDNQMNLWGQYVQSIERGLIARAPEAYRRNGAGMGLRQGAGAGARRGQRRGAIQPIQPPVQPQPGTGIRQQRGQVPDEQEEESEE
jgi:hypothetical protein